MKTSNITKYIEFDEMLLNSDRHLFRNWVCIGTVQVGTKRGMKTSYRSPTRVYPKFPDRVDDEIYAYNNKHSVSSNTKGYGGKTH